VATDHHWSAKGLMALTSAGLCVLAVLKAAGMGLTHDESYSFIHYLDDSFMEVVSYNMFPRLANNHILNTLWMRLADTVFGPNELALRGLSMIMLPIYLFALTPVAFGARSTIMAVAAFVLLASNQMLFEFFTLARGYSQGYTLLVCALVLRVFPLGGLRVDHQRLLALTLAGLAAFAQFTMLTAALALVAVDAAIVVFEPGANRWKRLWPGVVTLVVWGALLYQPLAVSLSSDLIFGSRDSFIQRSIVTLVLGSISGLWLSPWQVGLITVSVLSFLAVAFFIVLNDARTKGISTTLTSPLGLFTAVLFLTVTGNLVQVFFLGGYYLEGRTALVYLPLILITIVLLFQRMESAAKWVSYPAISAMVIFAALNLIAFNSGYSTHRTVEWAFDRDTRQVARWMKEQNDGKPKGSVRVDAYFIYEPSLNFYRIQLKADELAVIRRADSISDSTDLVVMPTDRLPELGLSESDCVQRFTEGEVCVIRPPRANQ
jgi:hypothetical protein